MTLPLSKQEWTETQIEVWKNVESYTKLIMNGDVECFLEYFHSDYSGWNYYALMPVNKSNVKNELQQPPKQKIVSYNINPVAINIFNDVAIVHYYFSGAYKNVNGKEISKRGRNTDILLKQKNKWVIIGDHVGCCRK